MPTPMLAELREQDAATTDKLINMLLEYLPQHEASIEQKLTLQEWENLKKEAHTVKGMLLNLGFAEAGKYCRQLEQAAQLENNDDAQKIWQSLQTELVTLKKSCQAHLAA